MYVCPHCTGRFDSTEFSASRQTCPDCGTAIRPEEIDQWTDVARVGNLAEAGFLSDELNGHGIDARVYQLDEFSAVHDLWRAKFLIQVPAAAAHDAAAHIREHLRQDAVDGDDEGTLCRTADRGTSSDPLFWRAVALVVLAGTASFVLGQRFSDQDAERRPPGDSLSSAISAIGRPLSTAPAPNQPRFQLSFDGHRESWLLESDHDGDGRYDSRQQFQASGAAW
jgi:hypothetical protein